MNRTSNLKKLIVIVIIVGLSLSVDAAEMYRWVDDEGVVHFSDEQPVGIKETKQLRIQDSEPKTEIPAVKPEVSVKKGTTSQPEPKRSPGRVVTRTQQKLENFPLVLQKHNWCAFASTEMVLKYYGFDIDQDEIFQRLKVIPFEVNKKFWLRYAKTGNKFFDNLVKPGQSIPCLLS